jgi:FSR family fosmidomycin resistance protein-like MFS transporter
MIQRHLSYTLAAGLVFATNIASSIVQPLFGHYADRFKCYWLMPLGLLVAGVGLASVGIFSNYWLIALSVCLSGIGVASFHPEGARLVNRMTGHKKATGMSIFSLGGNVGLALGPMVTTALLVWLGLPGVTWLIIPLALMAVLFVVASMLKVTDVPAESVVVQEVVSEKRPENWGAFARLTGAVVSRSMIFFGLNTFLPLYWIGRLHQSQAAGGMALSVLLIAGIIGTFFGGRLADRFNRRSVVITSFSILLPCLFLFVLLSPFNPILALVLLVPVGLCLFAPFSVMVVMGQEFLPNHVGTASGVTLGLGITVGGIVAPLLGHVADVYGISTTMFLLTIFPAISLGWIFSLPASKRKAASENSRNAVRTEPLSEQSLVGVGLSTQDHN